MQLILHNINCKAALPTTFTAKAVPNMLSSVLTDVMQMLPSAVNHTHKKQLVSVHVCGKALYNSFLRKIDESTSEDNSLRVV